MTDYYEILGLKKGSSDQEIKKAYRKLAMQYHPDRNAGDKASEAKFKQISEAYAVLSDKEKKNQYDTYGSNDFHQRYSSDDIFRGADFSSIFSEFGFGGAGGGGDIFNQLFGGGHGRQQRGYQRGPSKGQNVEYPLSIEFMEAYEGTERNIRFTLQGERGSERNISIKIPKGMESGKKLRVAGKGAPSPDGGPAGDLFVIVNVQGHPNYDRVGNNVESKVELKISEALLGCSKDVETPVGAKTIRIPAGVAPGTKMRLRGLGFPTLGQESRGDLFAVISIDVPKHLTESQLEAVQGIQAQGL